MNNRMKSNTFKITLGGMITALSVLFMFMTGLFPFATFALPGIAGALLIMAVVEMGKGWAALIYAAVSLLSLFIAPDKESAVVYVLILGHYAITKSLIERIDKKWIRIILKLAVFNITAGISYFIVIKFIGITEDLPFGKWFIAVFFAAANIAFIAYDYALTQLVILYFQKIRLTLKKIFRF